MTPLEPSAPFAPSPPTCDPDLQNAPTDVRKAAALRMQAEGVPVMTIAKRTGLAYGTVRTVLNTGTIATKPRGRSSGEGRSLNKDQELKILGALRLYTPRTCKIQVNCWTWETVAALIKNRCNVELSRRGVGTYLVRWGVQPMTGIPISRCTQDIQAWWAANRREIEAKSLQTRGVILWLNEPVSLDVAIWYPADEQPRGQQLHLLSACGGRGELYWKVISGRLTADLQGKFLTDLRKDHRKRLFLVRSKAAMYHGPNLMALMQEDMQRGLIRLLPPRPVEEKQLRTAPSHCPPGQDHQAASFSGFQT